MKKEKDDFPNLSGEQLQTLQNTFKDCEYLIIDEYSMLSQVMCAKINKRLKFNRLRFNRLRFNRLI